MLEAQPLGTLELAGQAMLAELGTFKGEGSRDAVCVTTSALPWRGVRQSFHKPLAASFPGSGASQRETIESRSNTHARHFLSRRDHRRG